jgi:hypothetical protein
MQGTTAATVPIAPIAPGVTYHQLRVRAENQLGVSAESPAGDPFSLDVIDDSDPSIVYSTPWTQTTDTAAYGGKLHTTSTAGATATLMGFSGRSIAVVAPVGSGSGSLQICLDPGASVTGCTTVMLQSSASVERRIVYVSGPLATGRTHTIEITTTSAFPVAVDGFVVLG